MTLLNNTSKNLHPYNTIATFTADVARPNELVSSDNWEVGLCEFTYLPNNVGTFKRTIIVCDSTGFIHFDLISPQYVGRALVRCMRTFIFPSLSGQHVFDKVYYVPGEKETFKSIRIETLQFTCKPVEFKCSMTQER